MHQFREYDECQSLLVADDERQERLKQRRLRLVGKSTNNNVRNEMGVLSMRERTSFQHAQHERAELITMCLKSACDIIVLRVDAKRCHALSFRKVDSECSPFPFIWDCREDAFVGRFQSPWRIQVCCRVTHRRWMQRARRRCAA